MRTRPFRPWHTLDQPDLPYLAESDDEQEPMNEPEWLDQLVADTTDQDLMIVRTFAPKVRQPVYDPTTRSWTVFYPPKSSVHLRSSHKLNLNLALAFSIPANQMGMLVPYGPLRDATGVECVPLHILPGDCVRPCKLQLLHRGKRIHELTPGSPIASLVLIKLSTPSRAIVTEGASSPPSPQHTHRSLSPIPFSQRDDQSQGKREGSK
jgi:hypothetical protein